MGSVISTNSTNNETRRIWPIRYFHQITSPEDMQSSRFGRWDPRMYMSEFKYPAKEPAKDF